MEPSIANLRDVKSGLKFCSEKCKALLTNKPSEIKTFVDLPASNVNFLAVMAVVKLKDVDSIYHSSASHISAKMLAKQLDQTLEDDNNTIISMLICKGNQEKHQRPFVLCALRSLNACRLVDFFVNSSFIPLDACPYMGYLSDSTIVDNLRETRLTQKIILEDKNFVSFLQGSVNLSTDSSDRNKEAISYIVNGLPSNFRVRYPTSGSEFNCIQIPKHHQFLLHSIDNDIPGQLRVFLLCFGDCYHDQSQEYPYIASIRVCHNEYTFSKKFAGHGNFSANGVIISDDGKNKVLSTLVDSTLIGNDVERGQQMVDSVLPDMLEKAGCRNVKALTYRALCKRYVTIF